MNGPTSFVVWVPVITIAVVAIVALVTVARARSAATAVDFQLAGRGIGVRMNALAICGDYVSAASFLGIAAVVYAIGLDGVWYATGFAAGFVPVALLAAAPMRRLGERTIPDFLARRYRSERVRLVAVAVTELVVLAYLVPQAVGAGIAWGLVTDRSLPGLSPYTTGIVVSTVAVMAIVVVGGMRGTTWTQAFQFAVLLTVLTWLSIAVLADGFSYDEAVGSLGDEPLRAIPEPVGRLDASTASGPIEVVDNHLGDGSARFDRPGARFDVLGQFSLVVTLVFGTVGLPHVMNRFFTSPSGRAARMTSAWVVAGIGAFYAMAVMLGTAARFYIEARADELGWLAEASVDGVLRVPEDAMLAMGRLFGGEIGLAVVATGAAIAIISTASGLVLAASASWGHDVYERYVNPVASRRRALRVGQAAVVVSALAAGALAVFLDPARLTVNGPSLIAGLVAAAFAVAGSALAPVIIIGIWWRGATAHGALAAMIVGATVSTTSAAIGLLVDGAPFVLSVPTIVAGPMALAALVVVSKRTAPTRDLDEVWIQMHGSARERRLAEIARLSVRTE